MEKYINDIANKENELFKRWQASKNYKTIAKDGVIDPEHWKLEQYKILYVLKEVNYYEEDFDLREFLKNGGSSTYWKTWNNIARWTKAILEGGDYLRNVSKDEKTKWLSRIAAINLKKVGGKSEADDGEIREYAINDSKELLEQIGLYNPDIIICCGRGNGKNADLLYENVFQVEGKESKLSTWQPPIEGYNYFYVQLDGDEKKIPVVSFYHPQMRGNHKLFERRFNEMKIIAETLRKNCPQ
ncbi:hypothetical protein OD350_10170 [Clostridium beijerinckii]|uniref:hypothetical protein n=1 Tax=Clostridium beijerinckii TaxID=1520 RepID=UPI0022269FF7|nr:hypothetical protein [Clostridium beijerinckii]UYZ38010.1 hypothetical protein OD350_10170 [Clostridium beijerinckii]